MGVIPANAGVILNNRIFQLPFLRYPRECGGDPVVKSEVGIEV